MKILLVHFKQVTRSYNKLLVFSFEKREFWEVLARSFFRELRELDLRGKTVAM